MLNVRSLLYPLLLLGLTLSGCAPTYEAGRVALEEVARSDRQWTGVAVSAEGRIFVNYPRWSDNVPVSVAELDENNQPLPYPDAEWNDWQPGKDPAQHFVCVQSVYVDERDTLWVLDPASPKFQGVVAGGAKLLRIDLDTDRVERIYEFGETIALTDSYLNDVRVDRKRNTAYLTDSGNGALIVLDLETGKARRVLEEHKSTQAEDLVLQIDGKPWRRPDGTAPEVHADGLALHPSGELLFYQALTGTRMYTIRTEYLRDGELSDEQLAGGVVEIGQTGPSDGLIYGPDRGVYISAIEENAVRVLRQGVGPGEARLLLLVRDERLAWPDSFAIGPDGLVYVSTSRIHEGSEPRGPYQIFKLVPTD